ncbi:unnamed protein product [Sphagnum compactum]
MSSGEHDQSVPEEAAAARKKIRKPNPEVEKEKKQAHVVMGGWGRVAFLHLILFCYFFTVKEVDLGGLILTRITCAASEVGGTESHSAVHRPRDSTVANSVNPKRIAAVYTVCTVDEDSIGKNHDQNGDPYSDEDESDEEEEDYGFHGQKSYEIPLIHVLQEPGTEVMQIIMTGRALSSAELASRD